MASHDPFAVTPAPPRPAGETVVQILDRGDAALSVHTTPGTWRHFGLVKGDDFGRRLVGGIERGDR